MDGEPQIPRPTSPSVEGGLFNVDASVLGNNPFEAFLDVLASFFSSAWSVYSLIAYILSIIFLIIYVYATIRWHQYLAIQSEELRAMERLYNEHFRGAPGQSRLEQVFIHIDSDNPNDWKLAIIEADIILDEIVKERGYAGNSLGERLRSISPAQLNSLDDAWAAHKVRNQIAHGGADFVLTKRLAEETINRYRRVFSEFGIV